MASKRLWRDASNRLTFTIGSISEIEYPIFCRKVADQFGLTPHGDFVVGWESIFWEFGRGDQVVGLDWEFWNDLLVFATEPISEPLVTEIADWLDANFEEIKKFCPKPNAVG